MKAFSFSHVKPMVAGAVFALSAVPAVMAASYGEVYYDASRDRMVTARDAAAVPPSQLHRVESPVQSSPGAVQPGAAMTPATAGGASTSAMVVAQAGGSYYDPVRDVIVNAPATPVNRGQAAIGPALGSTFEFVVRNGQLVAGPQQIAVDHGAEVTLVVDSNSADALRVDGYNLVAPIVPGRPVLVTFTAEQPGRFPYRLDSTGEAIGVIEVGPARPAGATLGMR